MHGHTTPMTLQSITNKGGRKITHKKGRDGQEGERRGRERGREEALSSFEAEIASPSRCRASELPCLHL